MIKLLILDKSVPIESGNHRELMAKHGQYYYLTQQQLGAIGND